MVRKLNLEALQDIAMAPYYEMIVGLAKGDDFDPDSVLSIASRAGRKPEQIQADVNREMERLEATTAFNVQRYFERAAQMLVDYRAAMEELKQLEAEYNEMGERLRKLREHARSLDHNRVRNEGEQKQRELKDFLRRTGRNGSLVPEEFALCD